MKRAIFSVLFVLPMLLSTGCKEEQALAWWLPNPWQPATLVYVTPPDPGTGADAANGAQNQTMP